MHQQEISSIDCNILVFCVSLYTGPDLEYGGPWGKNIWGEELFYLFGKKIVNHN